jgi:putative transposase
VRTYKRAWIAGGVYFFTVNLVERRNTTLLVDHVDELRKAFRLTKQDHLFDIEAIVVMPDHLHAIWRLPPNDSDFAARWRLIKARFSRQLGGNENISPSRLRKGERGIWQRRFWEHVIRDERDLQNHIDYIHFNPVKHGHVQHVIDWPHSSFHRYVRDGLYPEDWAAPKSIQELDLD